MIQDTFYHGTTRRYTVAFGSIFNGIKIHRVNQAGEVIDIIPVPLLYADKEKFVQRAVQLSSIDDDLRVKETLPAMGFELLDISYSPVRKTNTMERIVNDSSNSKFSFNRVPYDFTFGVYIAARRIDDALRIVEQILPYFTPELNIQIKDMDAFPDMKSDISITMDASNPDIDSGGTFDDRRIVQWNLTFTLKGYLYANVRDVALIKKTIVDLSDSDINSFYEGYMSQVDPLNAGANDDPNIIEQVTSDSRNAYVLNAYSGTDAQATMD